MDINNIDSELLENEFTRKIDDYVPYISVIYLSDKTKNWKNRLALWDGTLDLQNFLKNLKKSWYTRPISIKLDLKPSELANKSAIKKQFKKIRSYYDNFFLDIKNNEGDSDNENENEKG